MGKLPGLLPVAILETKAVEIALFEHVDYTVVHKRGAWKAKCHDVGVLTLKCKGRDPNWLYGYGIFPKGVLQCGFIFEK